MMPEMRKYVVANIATFPEREALLEKAVLSIISQVDQLNIYLNEYEDVPVFLKNKKINAVLSEDADGDLKDNGKFYFLNNVPNDAYYFSIDDDIVYPHDYVAKMLKKMSYYENKVAIGVHGVVFHQEFESFRCTRTSFYFEHELQNDIQTSILGTGTLAFYKGQFENLSLQNFKTMGSADLWFAVYCKENNIMMTCISRERLWLKSISQDLNENLYTLWNESAKNEKTQNDIINKYKLWEIGFNEIGAYRSYMEKELIKYELRDGLYFDEKIKKLENDLILVMKSKSFQIGNLFFRSIKSPKKMITFPINFLSILLGGEKRNTFLSRIKFLFFSPVNFVKKYFSNHCPKVLAIVNHYYGAGNDFKGKSSTQDVDVRKKIVEKTIKELRKIPNIEIRVCGISGKSLVDINKDFSYIADPSFLVYESIEWMASQVDKYDYFINVEDDVLLTRNTFNRILEFDKKNPINECYHPNRMEKGADGEYCVDLKAWPGWTEISKQYNGDEIRVANNPHSGIAVLSSDKLKYVIKNVDLKRRDKIIGHYMASAYANLHLPFKMFRNCLNLSKHKVIHLDKWNSE